MNYQNFELPNQRRPETEWKKKLYIEHANRMIEYIGSDYFTRRTELMSKYYRRYNCELSPKEEEVNETMTKQYGYDLGVEYMIYPLCEMVVDQMVGEYITTPLEKTIAAVNKDAVSKKLDEKVKYISEEIFREANKALEEELGFKPETENPDVELPDDIEVFFNKNYKTLAEELGMDLTEQFLEANKQKNKVKTLLQDYLISENCGAAITEKDGHPVIERFKYDEYYTDLDPDEEIQTDINIASWFPWRTENQILNDYDLEEKEIKKVQEMFVNMANNNLNQENFGFGEHLGTDTYQNCKSGVSYKGWFNGNAKNRVRILKMKWKSRKQIRAKIYINKKTGEEQFKLLSDDFKPRKRDKIKTIYVEIVRFVEMIGPEICLDYGIEEERITSVDNKKKVKLPVAVLSGGNSMYKHSIRSVVARVEQLQKVASDLLFELRLAMKSNDGRVMVYDVAQIPKQFLETYGPKKALSRVMHHVKKDKMILINSKDKNYRASFNQFTALDLSNRGQTQDIINALLLVEDLARKFVGLNKERQGEVGQYQTASGTNRAMIQSNARTEIYFNPFDEFLQQLLNVMLLKSKKIYKEGDVFPLVFGDLQTKFLTIYGDFHNEDLGVYFGNRFKDKKDKEIIDMAAQQALSNASDKELILDLINVLQGDSASESKAILEKGLSTYAKLQAANAKAAQEAQEAQMASNEKIEELKYKTHQEKMENNIDVANIYANNKAYTENEKNSSNELMTLAKIGSEQLKSEKEELKQSDNK